jgi:hypothetical protein
MWLVSHRRILGGMLRWVVHYIPEVNTVLLNRFEALGCGVETGAFRARRTFRNFLTIVAVDRPIVTSPKKMSERSKIKSIDRSHGDLTGPIRSRALNLNDLLDICSARGNDWPVKFQTT